MRLTHKLGKIFTGAAFESAGHHLRRFFLKNRAPANLDAEAIMKTIDGDAFEMIRARYGVENPGGDPPKYLDWRVWLDANLQRIRNLELDLGPPRRVLDIGSGSGYFLYICKLLGHDALGLDVPDVPMFTEMIRMLGVERVNWRISPYIPLPDLGRKFDVVTAHMICFNNHKHSNLCGVEEWYLFL
jgi:SAM-dependent methyltransferase